MHLFFAGILIQATLDVSFDKVIFKNFLVHNTSLKVEKAYSVLLRVSLWRLLADEKIQALFLLEIWLTAYALVFTVCSIYFKGAHLQKIFCLHLRYFTMPLFVDS